MILLLTGMAFPARNRGAARAAYQKALAYHQELQASPASRRTLEEYQRAIFLYRRVVDHDPTYGACDDALYAIASLYEEMAERYGSPVYRERAIYHYEFVAREYPLTKFRGQALARAATLRSPPPPKSPSRGASPLPDPNLASLSEIRYWSNEEYTRVVIQLSREVRFEKHVLQRPDRIYFDLHETALDPALVGKQYDVNGVFIQRIRVAENRPQVVRVVIDYNQIHKHSVFALYDPFRIVIDTHGDGKLAASQTPAEEATMKTAEAVIPLDPSADREPSRQEAVKETPPVAPAPNLHGDRSLTRVLGLKVGRVALDPGHGGKDTGTIGPTGLKEKDLVLDVALRLKKLLEERLGMDVILTRSSDTFVPLEERTAIANQKGADLFVSIHANASRNRNVTGIETFFLNFATSADEREVASRENAGAQRNNRELEDLLKQIALGDYNAESRELAHVVQKTFFTEMHSRRPSFRNRGVKQAPFIVLIGSNMPSILTEIGFLSNPDEEAYFKKEEARDEVAEALYQGIEEYFRSLGSLPEYIRTASGTGSATSP